MGALFRLNFVAGWLMPARFFVGGEGKTYVYVGDGGG